MDENRILKRYELIYNLKVIDNETLEPIGRAVDITSRGMKLITYKKMDHGAQISLAIDLPMEVFGNRKVLCRAVVRWCRKDVNPDFYANGLQFLDLSPDDLETLIAVMAQYSFNG